MKDKLQRMMKNLIVGEYNCNDFSYDFPDCMMALEDEELLAALDDMPEICAAYDTYKEDEPELLNDGEFIAKVEEIYKKVFG